MVETMRYHSASAGDLGAIPLRVLLSRIPKFNKVHKAHIDLEIKLATIGLTKKKIR
jgi:hypothetical protein